MLLGQTLDGMRVWDVRRAIQCLREIDGLGDVPLTLHGDAKWRASPCMPLCSSRTSRRSKLRELSKSHETGPDFLNVLRILICLKWLQWSPRTRTSQSISQH